MTINEVITTELVADDMTRLISLIEMQNTKIDAVLLCLERVYYLGLVILGVSSAVFVCMLFYNALKKLI